MMSYFDLAFGLYRLGATVYCTYLLVNALFVGGFVWYGGRNERTR